MKRLLTALRTVTQMRYPYTDPFEMQHAQSLWRMVWGVIAICLVVALVYIPFFSPGLAGGIGVVLGLVIIGMAVVLVLINSGNMLSATILFIMELFVGTTFSYLLVGSQVNLIAFSIPIIAAGVLINRRGMSVMLLLTFLVLGGAGGLSEIEALPHALVGAANAGRFYRGLSPPRG